MILFLADQPPLLSPLIQNIIEIKEEAPPPVEYTLEEKIKLNVNNCDEATQWIRADNAQCIPKKIQKPVKSAVKYATEGLNGYVLNSCTGWVATHRYVPAGWGNATSWKANAIKAGWTVSSTPVAGAIGWVYGHVVYIESVNGDTVTISERNYDYNGSIRTITVPTSKYTYLY